MCHGVDCEGFTNRIFCSGQDGATSGYASVVDLKGISDVFLRGCQTGASLYNMGEVLA